MGEDDCGMASKPKSGVVEGDQTFVLVALKWIEELWPGYERLLNASSRNPVCASQSSRICDD
jgi:hypothetical protein